MKNLSHDVCHIREGIYILLKTINFTFVKLHTYTKQPIIINISIFYHDLITMRGAMPTHLGANPRNHVNHDYSFSSLENFYYYDKNINTFVFNIDYLRKVSNDGKIFIISPEYYYYYTFVQNLLI